MADKDVKKEDISAEKPVEKSQKGAQAVPVAAGATMASSAPALDDRSRQVWVIWVVIVGFVVLILLVVAAIVVAHSVHEDNLDNRSQAMDRRDGNGFGFGYSYDGYGGYPNGSLYTQTSNSNGLTTTTTTTRYTYTTGVVTQVNSGSIVVAGNGQSQTIAIDPSTTYDGTKPAVNDTVYVIGTADSNGKITATEIQVAND